MGNATTKTVYGLRSRITGRLVKHSVDHAEVKKDLKTRTWRYRRQLEWVFKDPLTKKWAPISAMKEQ